jgi:3-dehydrosphinganine reductase
MYGIDIHIMFPATILSPGLAEENKIKPKITLKLEESDEGMQPEALAQHLLAGE